MLALTFFIGADRYTIAAYQVIEIVPWVVLRKIPHAPEYVAGLLNYRGVVVPVIDLTYLMLGFPSKQCLSTRIILANYSGKNDTQHILGILVERVAATDGQEKKGGVDSGITVDGAPYLGDISIDEQDMVQVVRIESILPDSLHKFLFSEQEKKSLDD